MTEDYPPEYYQSRRDEALDKIALLEARIEALESKGGLSPTMRLGMALAKKEIAKQPPNRPVEKPKQQKRQTKWVDL